MAFLLELLDQLSGTGKRCLQVLLIQPAQDAKVLLRLRHRLVIERTAVEAEKAALLDNAQSWMSHFNHRFTLGK